MSAPTGALRRRRKRSLATRLRIAWVFLVGIAAVAAYAVYMLVTLPALRARDVVVNVPAGSALSEAQVRAAAQIDPNANVWLIDTAKIARAIEALPYVAHAGVHRIPPALLVIDVHVRTVAACVRSGVGSVAVDAQRRVLQTGCPSPDPLDIDLPQTDLGPPGTFANSPELAALLGDAQTLLAAHLDVRRVGHDRFGELIAYQSGGVQLLFGSDADLGQKASLVAPVMAAARPAHAVRVVDLRAPGTPIVDFR